MGQTMTPETETETETVTVAAPEMFTPAKRRGRPPKNPPGETPTPVDGASAAPAKKRGRPPKAISHESRGMMARQLAGLHLIAAGALGIPELQLAESEAESLAQGIAAVCDEYGLSLSGKTGAALQLFAAAAMVYAPRFFAVKARIEKTKAENKSAENGFDAHASTH